MAGAALVDKILEILGAEWRVTAEEGVGDDAQRPHVHGLSVALLKHHLGGGIAKRPSHGGEDLILGTEHLCNAKIRQDEVGVRLLGSIEKVLRFEIWMQVRLLSKRTAAPISPCKDLPR